MRDIKAYPVATSQILIVLSRLALTIKSPEGKKQTLETLWSCPERVLMHVYVVKSHSFTCMSAEQETSRLPEGSKPTSCTASV